MSTKTNALILIRHTNSAAKTIDRIVDAFPANMKEMIRTQLSTSIVAVISQTLCKKTSDLLVHAMMGVHQIPNTISAPEKAPSMIW